MTHTEELEFTWKKPDWFAEDSDPRLAPPKLYHYTSSEGLFGIVHSRSLRATEIHYLSDFQELEHATNIARKIINDTCRSMPDDGAANLWKMLLATVDVVESGSEIFVFSLTEVPDLLSQWRAYCPKGGFSIGFPRTLLVAAANEQNFFFIRCRYDDEKLETVLGDLIDSIVSQFLEEWSKIDPSDESRLLTAASAMLRSNLDLIAMQFKHQGFEEEKEWRLITMTTDLHKPKVAFRRASESLLIPFTKIEIEGLQKELSVVIGPSPRQHLSYQSVKSFFLHEGLPVSNITECPIPYFSG